MYPAGCLDCQPRLRWVLTFRTHAQLDPPLLLLLGDSTLDWCTTSQGNWTQVCLAIFRIIPVSPLLVVATVVKLKI